MVLGVQHAHPHRADADQGQDGHHDLREETAQGDLGRIAAETARDQRNQLVREDHSGQGKTAGDGQHASQNQIAKPEGALAAALVERIGEGRDKRARQRALGEQIAQQVGNAEGRHIGVGQPADPERSCEDGVAHHAQHPRRENGDADLGRGTKCAGHWPRR